MTTTRTNSRCLPVTQWPTATRHAWAAACRSGDIFDVARIAAAWAAPTRRHVEKGFGRWLAWLDEQGLIDSAVAPETHATRDRVASYATHLASEHAAHTVANRIQALGDALRAMVPDTDWRWVLRASYRMRASAIPVRDKRRRLQSPEQLADVGKRLMADADRTAHAIDRAEHFRNGLLIAFLAHRPIRGRNLASMTVTEHVMNRGGRWFVSFRASEVKNRRPLEFPFPTALVSQLETYLSVHRPILVSGATPLALAATDAVWVSRHGTRLGYQTIAHHVRRQTRAAFGVELNPHLFRDCAATAIAVAAPEDVRIIAAILGHSSLRTSERHYNQARGLEASRRYHATLVKLREQARRPRGV